MSLRVFLLTGHRPWAKHELPSLFHERVNAALGPNTFPIASAPPLTLDEQDTISQEASFANEEGDCVVEATPSPHQPIRETN